MHPEFLRLLRKVPTLGGKPPKMRLEMPQVRPMLPPMGASSYSDIKDSLRDLYLGDARPWLVGFSGGNDSTMLESFIVEVGDRISAEQRRKSVVEEMGLSAREAGLN